MALFLLFFLLIPGILAFVLLPRTLRFAGEIAGYFLRRSSRTRRELLLARVEREKKAYKSNTNVEKSGEDGWEAATDDTNDKQHGIPAYLVASVAFLTHCTHS